MYCEVNIRQAPLRARGGPPVFKYLRTVGDGGCLAGEVLWLRTLARSELSCRRAEPKTRGTAASPKARDLNTNGTAFSGRANLQLRLHITSSFADQRPTLVFFSGKREKATATLFRSSN